MGLVREICRFRGLHYEKIDPISFTAIIQSEDKGEPYLGISYIRSQIEPLYKGKGRRLLTKLGWSTALYHGRMEQLRICDEARAAREKIEVKEGTSEEPSKHFEDIIEYGIDLLGLEQTVENRKRYLTYCYDGHIPSVEEGFLKDTSRMFSYRDKQREIRVYRYLTGLYIRFLTMEKEYAEDSKIGKSKEELVYSFGIQPLIDKKDAKKFLEETIDEEVFLCRT